MENEEKVLIPIDKYNKIVSKAEKWDSVIAELTTYIRSMFEHKDMAIRIVTEEKLDYNDRPWSSKKEITKITSNIISIDDELKKANDEINRLNEKLACTEEKVESLRLDLSFEKSNTKRAEKDVMDMCSKMANYQILSYRDSCRFELIEDVKKFNKLPWYKKIFYNFEFDEDAFK